MSRLRRKAAVKDRTSDFPEIKLETENDGRGLPVEVSPVDRFRKRTAEFTAEDRAEFQGYL